jgi:hypothetical protein
LFALAILGRFDVGFNRCHGASVVSRRTLGQLPRGGMFYPPLVIDDATVSSAELHIEGRGGIP